jgi:hypothetical protein
LIFLKSPILRPCIFYSASFPLLEAVPFSPFEVCPEVPCPSSFLPDFFRLRGF